MFRFALAILAVLLLFFLARAWTGSTNAWRPRIGESYEIYRNRQPPDPNTGGSRPTMSRDAFERLSMQPGGYY